MQQIQTKVITVLMTFALALFLLPWAALAAGTTPAITDCEANFGYDFKITFNDARWLSSVTGVTVAGQSYDAGSSSFSVYNNTSYYVDAANNLIYIGEGGAFGDDGKAACVITSDGYDDLTIMLDKNARSASVVEQEQKPEKPEPDPAPAPEPQFKMPPAPADCTSNFGYDFKITFDDTVWLSSVTGVTIAGQSYTAADSSYGVWNDTDYYVDAGNNYILVGEGGAFSEGKAVCIISAEGYRALTMILDKTSHSILDTEEGKDPGANPDPDNPNPDNPDPDNPDPDNPNPGNPDPQPPIESNKKPAPTVTAEMTTGFDSYRILTVQAADGTEEYVKGITELSVNDTPWAETSSKSALFSKGSYYRDTENNRIYFAPYNDIFTKGDKITIKHDGYENLILSVTACDGSTFQVAPYNNDAPVTQDQLHIRLVGYFDAALKGQLKYDAISGASTSVSTNQNSNVTVQVASLPEGQAPEEGDWKTLDINSGITIHPDRSKTCVTIRQDDGSENSGMAGVYSPYDGSLTLAGTPATPGTYAVQVTFTDSQGRTAASNTLPFLIYEGNETLSDCLKLENATQTADGKYMYDMEPWAIKNFGGNEKVTVPAEIKAWYGSHTSGTYGELGYAVSDYIPRQTLTIPAGCNLTLVNMKILSSVRIIVENGGKLTLRDSSVFGIIEVNHGGTFSMNYDDYAEGGRFLTGASMNGQLILNDGATLANASIYSNTNNLTDSGQARTNTEPVVVVNGAVHVSGQVFIRGDEAPTGTNPATGKSYAGQTALKVESGGTLVIPEGAVLAAYGGGRNATTSVGGTALILDGTVTGKGTLIAVGGSGTFDNGGNAVSDSGTLSPAGVYLEGGNASMPKDGSIMAGKAMADTVTLSDATNRTLKDGIRKADSYGDAVSPAYWSDITNVPDVAALYRIDANAPGQQKPDDNVQKPDDGKTDTNNSGQKPDGDKTDTDNSQQKPDNNGNGTDNSTQKPNDDKTGTASNGQSPDDNRTDTTNSGTGTNGSANTSTTGNSSHTSGTGGSHTPDMNGNQNGGSDTGKSDTPAAENNAEKSDAPEAAISTGEADAPGTAATTATSSMPPAANTARYTASVTAGRNATANQSEQPADTDTEKATEETTPEETESVPGTEAETETVPLLEDESVPLSGNMDTHSQGNTAVKMFAGFLILLLLAAAGFIYRYVRQHRDEA